MGCRWDADGMHPGRASQGGGGGIPHTLEPGRGIADTTAVTDDTADCRWRILCPGKGVRSGRLIRFASSDPSVIHLSRGTAEYVRCRSHRTCRILKFMSAACRFLSFVSVVASCPLTLPPMGSKVVGSCPAVCRVPRWNPSVLTPAGWRPRYGNHIRTCCAGGPIPTAFQRHPKRTTPVIPIPQTCARRNSGGIPQVSRGSVSSGFACRGQLLARRSRNPNAARPNPGPGPGACPPFLPAAANG